MDASITPAAPAQAEQDAHRAALWALLFGNFVIGAGILAPAGLHILHLCGAGVRHILGGRLLTVGHASALGYVGAGLVGLAIIGWVAARVRFRA
jgi:hypothetical protein